jgi:hypothetical protein
MYYCLKNDGEIKSSWKDNTSTYFRKLSAADEKYTSTNLINKIVC